MIEVSRLNQTIILINPDLIEFIEETPDTMISMNTGRKLVVLESAETVVDRIVAFRQRAMNSLVPIDIIRQRPDNTEA